MKYLALKRRRDLKRRKWQYGAVLLTVFLGVMLYASSYDAYRNLDGSYKRTYERLAFADMLVTGARTGFDAEVLSVPGVTAATERLQADTGARLNGNTLIGRLVGVAGGEQPAVDQVDVVDGAYLNANDRDGVLAEIHFAKHFGLKVGDTLEIFTGTSWADVTVRGIVVSPEYIWPAASRQNLFPNPEEFGVMFANERLLASLPEGVAVRQVGVLYDEGADVTATDRAVKRAANTADASDTQTQARHPSNDALSLDVQGFEQMAYMFPMLFLLAAGMAVYMLLTRLVYRERAEIGTLRANGVPRRDILRHYLGYGLWIGVAGAALGIVAGIPLGWLMTEAYTAELGIPDTLRSLYPITPVVGLLFGVVTGVLSAWVPARAAAAISPAEAMRGDVPTAGGHVSLAERIVPDLKRMPVLWRMALRGIGRNRRRSVTTVTGVVLALMLVLTSWGMIDTTVYLMDRQFNEIALQDVVVVFGQTVSDSVVRRVRDTDGVRAAEAVTALSVTIKGPEDDYATQLQGFASDTQMHFFDGADGVPEGGIVAGVSIGELVGAEIGDVVTVDVPGFDTRFDAKILAFADEPMGTFVYAERGWLADQLATADPPISESKLRGPATTIAMARIDPAQTRSRVIDRIDALSEVANVSDSRILYDLVQQYMGLFYAFVGIMLLFGGLMALSLIFNIMSVNFAERAVEIATMRANGFSRQAVAGLIVGENMMLTAAGIPIGLLVGYGSAYAFMASYSTDLFSFDLVVEPMTYVYSSLIVFAITGLAMLPGIRAVGRIDIARIVRERSQ